jgi:hypothetical protein
LATSRSDQWERIAIASDLHPFFLCKPSWKLFLGICTENKFDRVILNGDFLDCTSISSHASKINLFNSEVLQDYSFDDELSLTMNEVLRPLRKAIEKAKLDLRLGNHEMRFLRPDRANPKALAEILETCVKRRATRLEDLLQLDKFQARLSYNAVDVLYKTFTLSHGVKTSAGAAKANLSKYGSGSSGHSHRINSHRQLMHGTVEGWWESGCMRTFKKGVEYLPHGDIPDWANGFLSLTINKNTRKFFCKSHDIIGGEAEFNGVIYKA